MLSGLVIQTDIGHLHDPNLDVNFGTSLYIDSEGMNGIPELIIAGDDVMGMMTLGLRSATSPANHHRHTYCKHGLVFELMN